jgi:tRNA-specific 2-thiouridylase
MDKHQNKTVAMGMSGGVDSSVAAALLKQQGYFVVGIYMKNWTQDVGGVGCTWARDSEDARKVCAKLKIPFYIWDFQQEYKKRVIDIFFDEYRKGRTPNPDILCNSEIKFGMFLDKALELGAHFVATGHYARVSSTGRGEAKIYHLLKGLDKAKDQSYFLYRLTQKQLSRCLFPLGGMIKTEVRVYAKKLGLPNFAKEDSQGICFIGEVDVGKFLKEHIRHKPGNITDTKGRIIGRHQGLAFYTIGQRGLGLGGDGPYYVCGKDLKKNQIKVTKNPNDKLLWRKKFEIGNVTFTSGAEIKYPGKCKVVIRYHGPETDALIKSLKNGSISVLSKIPQRAITEGQSAVLIKGQEVIGGGIIQLVR